MKIKPIHLEEKESQLIYEEILKHKEIKLNQCYLNTFAVASFLRNNRKKAKNYKVAYGYMKVINDKEEGYEDWQYNSYVRHAFIVNDKNKVVDISYSHLKTIKPKETIPSYLIMKKYSIDEYLDIVMKMLKNNPLTIDLVWNNGEIKNENDFKLQAQKEGYVLVD